MTSCRRDLKCALGHVMTRDVTKIKFLGLFGRQRAPKFGELSTAQLPKRFNDAAPYALYAPRAVLSRADKRKVLPLGAQGVGKQAGNRPHRPFQRELPGKQQAIEHGRVHLARCAQQADGYGKVEAGTGFAQRARCKVYHHFAARHAETAGSQRSPHALPRFLHRSIGHPDHRKARHPITHAHFDLNGNRLHAAQRCGMHHARRAHSDSAPKALM